MGRKVRDGSRPHSREARTTCREDRLRCQQHNVARVLLERRRGWSSPTSKQVRPMVPMYAGMLLPIDSTGGSRSVGSRGVSRWKDLPHATFRV